MWTTPSSHIIQKQQHRSHHHVRVLQVIAKWAKMCRILTAGALAQRIFQRVGAGAHGWAVLTVRMRHVQKTLAGFRSGRGLRERAHALATLGLYEFLHLQRDPVPPPVQTSSVKNTLLPYSIWLYFKCRSFTWCRENKRTCMWRQIAGSGFLKSNLCVCVLKMLKLNSNLRRTFCVVFNPYYSLLFCHMFTFLVILQIHFFSFYNRFSQVNLVSFSRFLIMSWDINVVKTWS